MTKELPRARFVPPPERKDEPLPLPNTTMGCWGGDEPRERLPPDASYLQPVTWSDVQRTRRGAFLAGAGAALVLGAIAWAVWL